MSAVKRIRQWMLLYINLSNSCII